MVTGLYNDNRFRAHPFLAGSIGGPGAPGIDGMDLDAVVDAGFIMGLHSGYEAGVHSVWLDSVSRLGTVVTFTFASDAPGLFERTLTFTRILGGEPFAVEHVDDTGLADGYERVSDSAVLMVSGDSDGALADCPPEPLWSGYLVTGYMAGLRDQLPSGQSFVRVASTAGVVEPALVQSTAGCYVASVNVANQDRTRIDAPSGCPPVGWPFPTGDDVLYPSARCLRGDVRFRAGYNSSIRQEDFNNAIVFGAEVGAGAGTTCGAQPKLFPGERVPVGDDAAGGLLEGGPRCDEVIRSINGTGDAFATLIAGPGVKVTPVPDQHRVIVDVNMSRLAVCYSDDPFTAVSEVV